ncbi:MAG: deoxynucleoside kinase [Oscillospiraceae bacterium]|nr:deoxynucleoside kinase [Oscillospiraceae bacterium]
MSKGKLIVLEGIDGSGKSAQYRRLCARFERDGIAYHHIVFPRYERDSSALIRMYLGGQFGLRPSDVNAYAASTFYAVDRYASYCEDWGKLYENGGLIISDRYTTSNAVHQGSKLPDDELPDFFEWLSDLEYRKMGLPAPDLVIYLDVDLETSLRRMRRREAKNHTHADIHEKDTQYLARCLHTADMACRHYGWTRIPFLKDGAERDVDEKNAEIYRIILDSIQK